MRYYLIVEPNCELNYTRFGVLRAFAPFLENC